MTNGFCFQARKSGKLVNSKHFHVGQSNPIWRGFFFLDLIVKRCTHKAGDFSHPILSPMMLNWCEVTFSIENNSSFSDKVIKRVKHFCGDLRHVGNWSAQLERKKLQQSKPENKINSVENEKMNRWDRWFRCVTQLVFAIGWDGIRRQTNKSINLLGFYSRREFFELRGIFLASKLICFGQIVC